MRREIHTEAAFNTAYFASIVAQDPLYNNTVGINAALNVGAHLDFGAVPATSLFRMSGGARRCAALDPRLPWPWGLAAAKRLLLPAATDRGCNSVTATPLLTLQGNALIPFQPHKGMPSSPFNRSQAPSP